MFATGMVIVTHGLFYQLNIVPTMIALGPWPSLYQNINLERSATDGVLTK